MLVFSAFFTESASVCYAEGVEYTVSLYFGFGESVQDIQIAEGGTVPSVPVFGLTNRAGYTLIGWYVGSVEGELFYFEGAGTPTRIYSDVSLYARWRLEPPAVFTMNDFSKTYDGTSTDISLTVQHLANIANLTLYYTWNKRIDGQWQVIELDGDTLTVKDVSDSGDYRVRCYAEDAYGVKSLNSSWVSFNVKITEPDSGDSSPDGNPDSDKVAESGSPSANIWLNFAVGCVALLALGVIPVAAKKR